MQFRIGLAGELAARLMLQCHIHTKCYRFADCHSGNGLFLQSLEPFYDQFAPDFINIRKTVREVLQKEDDLNEIVQLVGKVCICVAPLRFRICFVNP